MPAEAKHLHISRELLSEIASGQYEPSGRLPSESQLVRRFGVSRPTVARALRDLQNQGLIERRVGSGSFVSRSGGGTTGAGKPPLRQLGLLMPGLGTTEFFIAVCGELSGLARGHEYGLFWGGGPLGVPQAEATLDTAEELCEQFVRREVSGVFFAPAEHTPRSNEVNRRVTERLRQAGIAVVLLDRDLVPFPTRTEFDLVGIDNFAGGYLLAEHLIKLGCRRLAYLVRARSAPTAAARIAGAREAIIDHGLTVSPDFVLVGEPDDPRVAGKLTDRSKKSDRIDAVQCANDHLAAELMHALVRQGIQVPRDLRVVGFDDVRYATWLPVPLTTVHQPCREIAAIAFRAMLERVADPAIPPRSLVLTPRLVVRESCGAYLPRAAP